MKVGTGISRSKRNDEFCSISCRFFLIKETFPLSLWLARIFSSLLLETMQTASRFLCWCRGAQRNFEEAEVNSGNQRLLRTWLELLAAPGSSCSCCLWLNAFIKVLLCFVQLLPHEGPFLVILKPPMPQLWFKHRIKSSTS